jgi:hypothetical protein
MLAHPFRTFVAALLIAQASAAQASLQGVTTSGPHLLSLATDGGLSGALVQLDDEWAPGLTVLAATDGAKHLRRFGQQLLAVNRAAGTIQRVPLDGGPSQLYTLGAASEPMDVLVVGAASATGLAWVTRRDDPMLLRLDLASGAGTNSIDLSPVGGGAPIALGTMARHGTRLFVQVCVEDTGFASYAAPTVPLEDTGVLAVVDLVSEQLIDVDARTPGIQGIALSGAPPRFKMQIVGDTLFVSTTDSLYDERGGIERVDLNSLTSVGYAITEATGHSDMGGFVMLDAKRGYYVYHTDLLTSTHLVSFSVEDGPVPGNLIDLLGDTVDVLVYDPSRQRVYLPSGSSVNDPGLYAFSTETDTLVGPPLDTGFRPWDVVLAPSVVPAKRGF